VSTVVATAPSAEVDLRAAYTGFTLAYVIGHGTAALSKGDNPAVSLPAWLPLALLAAGIVPALTLAIRAGLRAQQTAPESRRLAEKLLGAAWCTGFTALFLAITGLATARDEPTLQDVLWPAGSVLLVGLLTIAEGVVRHNTLHYTLGSWLALVGGAALFFDTAGVYATVSILGGGGYAAAAVLERKRLATVSRV
jgi:hypothetical protein